MHHRFLFEPDFSAPHPSTLPDDHDPIVIDHDVEAHQSRYDDGYTAGYAAALAEIQSEVTDYFKRIESRLSAFTDQHQMRKAEFETLIYSSIAELIRHFGTLMDPINILTRPEFGFSNILSSLDQNSHIILTASPETLNRLTPLLDKIGLDHRLDVMPHDGMSNGDFEFKWRDGGLTFDQDAITLRFANLIEDHRNLTNGTHIKSGETAE